MKKLIVRFIAFLLIVGGLTTSFLIVKPREVVKADTPSLYYFDIDTSRENFMTIILYVLDVANLQTDTCQLNLYKSLNTPPYSASTSSSSVQFLRYSQLDHDDYNAYIYNYTYPTIESGMGVMIHINTYHVIDFDNSSQVEYDLYLPYYPTFKQYYDNGHQDGYQDGYQDGTNDRNAYWEEYIETTYESSTGSGYQRIYEVGRTAGYRQGQESLDTMSWFQTITSGVSDVMNIHLLPSITIGTLIFIPFMFMVLGAVLWIWRKK